MPAEKKKRFERNIGGMVIAACVGVLLALIFSNAYLLDRSSRIADKVRHDQEISLVRKDIELQSTLMALDQSQISNWGATIEAVSGDPDMDFVRTEIATWLWEDFDIQMTVVVNPNNQPIVTTFEDKVLAPSDGLRATRDYLDLINNARRVYKELVDAQTVPITKFSGDYDPVRSDHPIFQWSVRTNNGRLTFVMAQAIVPSEEGYTVGEEPLVFLTLKPIDGVMIKRIGDQMGVSDFHFTFDDREYSGAGVLPIAKLPNGKIAHGRWTPGSPSQAIWDQTIPTLAVPFTLVIIALGLIAWRFSHIVRELQYSEGQNRFLALHDALTGLPNRLHFDRELEQIISKGKQDRCAILCLDLDRFKAVNDTFGHQAGDVVLSVISERIKARVENRGIAARVGGDEFTILLHNNLDTDSVLHLCDQLIEDISEPILVPGGAAEVGGSIGVAWWPDDALTVKSIIRSADEALYSSKVNGRGRVSCASKLRRRSDQAEIMPKQNAVDQLRDELSKAG